MLPKGESQCRSRYDSYSRNARRNGVDFFLTLDDFKILTKKTCYYCGAEGTPFGRIGGNGKRSNGDYIGNGIDRKDNNIGYLFENCLPCCWQCNRMKSSMPYEQFVSHIYRISIVLRNEMEEKYGYTRVGI